MNPTLSMIMNSFSTFSTEELLALNKGLCATIKFRNTQKQVAASAEFKVGEQVTFFSKRGMRVNLIVTGFNRARTSVKGYEVDNTVRTWTVSCNLLSKV